MPDRIIFEESGIEIEVPATPASPSDLAEVMVNLRNASPDRPHAPLSDVGLMRLLDRAFYLSFEAEEGRYPRLRLVSQDPGSSLFPKFSSPIPFENMNEIRKLIPAVSGPTTALLVSEPENGVLAATGLVNTGHKGFQSKPDRPEIVSIGGPPSLLIRIEGPAHFFVTETTFSFEYRAGNVRLVRSVFNFVPGLKKWLNADSCG